MKEPDGGKTSIISEVQFIAQTTVQDVKSLYRTSIQIARQSLQMRKR